MNHPPNDIVTPDEIAEYIRKRKVSEQAAYGLKLLRRAAETIAYLNHQLGNVPKDTEASADDTADATPPHNEALEQVALALGADFYEKHPEMYSLDDVLEHIKSMHQTTAILVESNNQLQEAVNGIDRATMFVDETVSEAHGATDDTVNQAEWIKDATNFAHKVHGATLVMDLTQGVRELQIYAESLIEKSPAN